MFRFKFDRWAGHADYIVRYERVRKDGSLVSYGRLKYGRILEVIFRKKETSIFVITAYDLEDQGLRDFIIRNSE